LYESAVETIIHAVDQYHAVEGFSLGTGQQRAALTGMTFLESANGEITDTADNGGVLRVTDVGHGLTTGQAVTLNGMADVLHVGTTVVTVITEDVFDADDITYNSDNDTGFWQRGTSLTVLAGYGGTFTAMFSESFLSAANNKNFKFELVRITDEVDEFAAERKVAIVGDLGNLASAGFLVVGGEDTIWMQVMGTTDDTNFTIRHGNIHIHK
jgi:hypothetical protein